MPMVNFMHLSLKRGLQTTKFLQILPYDPREIFASSQSCWPAYQTSGYVFSQSHISRWTIGYNIPVHGNWWFNADHIVDTCNDLWNVLIPEYMWRPSFPEEWRKISEGFEHLWNFPHCVGAIDGKHVVNEAPSRSGSTFSTTKKPTVLYWLQCVMPTTVLLLLTSEIPADTVMAAHWVTQEVPADTFSNSAFGQAMESGKPLLPEPATLPGSSTPIPYMFVGDAAFALKTYMLRQIFTREQACCAF